MSDQNANSDIVASDTGITNIDDGLPGSGDFTETTSRSWFGRIGESLKAILIGIVLVVVAAILMFWNEGRSAKTAAALSDGAGQVVAVQADAVAPANEGKLIHVA